MHLHKEKCYTEPTLRIQLQIWPLVTSDTELTMHTELKLFEVLPSFFLAFFWVSAFTHYPLFSQLSQFTVYKNTTFVISALLWPFLTKNQSLDS